MAYLAVALMFVAGIAGGVALALTGHPGLAFFVLLITGCIELRKHDKKGDE